MNKIRIYHKKELKMYYPKGIFWNEKKTLFEKKENEMFMIDNGKLIDSSDCIIMNPSEKLDERNKMIYAGDIVRLIDVGNDYFNETNSGVGFIRFDMFKAQFIWQSFDGYPSYSMAGKKLVKLGNVLEDKNIVLKYNFNIFSLSQISNGRHREFIEDFFMENPNYYKRCVLTEKYQSKEMIESKRKEKKYIDKILRIKNISEETERLHLISNLKRKQRYMKIYENIKKELSEGKNGITHSIN